MTTRATVPLLLAALGLLGASGVALFFHRAATRALEDELSARLASAGGAAAVLLPRDVGDPVLAELMRVNELDGAYVVGPGRRVLADARGGAPGPVDLLRTDVARVARALEGESTVSADYRLGDVPMLTGYFPVGARGEAVLVLEAGERFVASRGELGRALLLGLLMSLGAALALGLVARRSQRAESEREAALVRASRGEALSRMAAIAAHEIRNPLSVIQATVELLRERLGQTLDGRGQASLEDVIGEVRRLRRLTEDLLDLAADRPLQRQPLALADLLGEVARGVERAHPAVQVRLAMPERLLVEGDAVRLRQVFDNLLKNAAQAQRDGVVEVHAASEGAAVVVQVKDAGPGVPPELRPQLFELFVTTRSGGTGLGLAVSRRLTEAHGGTLRLVPSEQGATFEVRLPRQTGEA